MKELACRFSSLVREVRVRLTSVVAYSVLSVSISNGVNPGSTCDSSLDLYVGYLGPSNLLAVSQGGRISNRQGYLAVNLFSIAFFEPPPTM